MRRKNGFKKMVAVLLTGLMLLAGVSGAAAKWKVNDLLRLWPAETQATLNQLNAMGVPYSGNSYLLLVDGNATNATDADDSVHGYRWSVPLNTIDYAMGLAIEPGTSDSTGTIIVVAPYHIERLGGTEGGVADPNTSTTIDLDSQGIYLVGLGEGKTRPKIRLMETDATVAIGDTDCTVRNLWVYSEKANTVAGVSIEAAGDRATLLDMYFEDSAANVEILAAISIAEGANGTIIKRCEGRGNTGCSSFVYTASTATDLWVEDCYAKGPYSESVFDLNDDALSGTVVIKNCRGYNSLATAGAGGCIELNTSTAAQILGGEFLSADGDAVPIAGTDVGFLLQVQTCEPSNYSIFTAAEAATDWGS